jgi:hypothetical protein
MLQRIKIFNDPVHGFISIPSDLIFNIIEHPYFQRLRRIKQLGLTEFVYPGALHTRFHHALGAMHLMHTALKALREKGIAISDEEEESALIAILLHDIGHGPYSHTLEHCLIHGVNHEEISRIMMAKLNREMNGELSMAISIFEDTYPKKFLHQLVSSQLDVDRLDYLTRDSFFTGVSEGVVGYDRIIKMLDVKKDELVVEAKGIYSIEKFIIARRLMYWQVYLHKTVLCVEQMMIKALLRAQELYHQAMPLPATRDLEFFLSNEVTLKDFQEKDYVLEHFSRLDDVDVFSALKMWRYSTDKVLAMICNAIVDRKLFRIELQDHAFSVDRINSLREKVAAQLGITLHEASFLVFTESTGNHAYNPNAGRIGIVDKEGRVKDIAEASDQLNIMVLSKPVIKYYLCYPKHLLD